MKRFLLSSLLAVFLLSQSAALVAALTLNKIGNSTVTGGISSWSYTGTNPIFTGTANPSETVSISVQSINQSVTADASGNWTYSPTTLTANGDYPITIAAGGQTISFILTLSNLTGTTSTTSTTTTTSTTSGQPTLPSELPQTGTAQETMLMLAGGLGLITGGVLFYWKVVPKLLFEESSDSADSLDNHLR